MRTPTVADLVRRGELGLRLHTSAEVAEQSVVQWAHAIDRPDAARWVAPGTLVLSGGFQMAEDYAGLAADLDRLHAAGAAGLALDAAGRWPEVPAALVRRGTELGVPVLSVAAEIPFATVVRTVAEEIVAARVRALTALVERQSRLTRAMLAGGLPAMLREVAGMLGAVAAVVSAEGVVLAAAGDAAEIAAALPEPPFTPSAGPSARGGRGTRMVLPLAGAEGEDPGAGRGALVLDTESPPDELDRVLAGHVAALAALSLARSRAVHGVEEALRADATAAVAAGRTPPAEQLGLFGLTPQAEVRAVLVHGVTGPPVAAVLRESGRAHLHGPAAGGRLVLHGGADDLAEGLAGIDGARVGVGSAMPLAAAVSSLRQAELAVPAAGAVARVRRFTGMAAHELLLGLLDDQAAELLAAGLLRRLEEHDAATGEGTVAAVEAFLVANGRVEAMARRLGVHRQTARARVDRVEAVLDASLDDPDVRAELWLGLRSRAAAPAQPPSSGGGSR
ncbi:hypothetical protein CSPHI_11315 [Corynebacterium sphenisci DSM 44792]|uniref:PucR family transcriptional regulator n=1 Tax=Corynebacterium sphenisci DSM 44792 TaxID=1437874 RepID=A0A1L7D0A7_9CORY|nr:PucR family transcriptional regulator [Corynebacterium sphenisci]APT91462.1 hypothetical protein CSPHI_11315 [Corynebacterium sphenisci DSM 44792]